MGRLQEGLVSETCQGQAPGTTRLVCVHSTPALCMLTLEDARMLFFGGGGPSQIVFTPKSNQCALVLFLLVSDKRTRNMQ